METKLDDLSKEELIKEVEKYRNPSVQALSSRLYFNGFCETCSKCGCSHSEGAGICKSCNEGYDKYKEIFLVKTSDGFEVKTVKKYRKELKDKESYLLIGDECDVLRPFIDNGSIAAGHKCNKDFCYPTILKENDVCSCERIIRLDEFKKKDYRSIIEDKILIKVFNSWDHLFTENIKKPYSFYDLKAQYNAKI